MPNLALDGTLSDHRPSLSGESGQVWQVGVNLNWQLLDGGARKASLRRAQAGLKIALLTERQTRVQVRADVTRAHTAAKAAQGRIVTAKSGVSAAQAWVTLARDRYELGVALLTDLQEAEDRLNESRLALLTARHDLAVAHARLVAATGGTL
jgi:outer membrane protein TolC